MQKYFDQMAEELCGGECGKRLCGGESMMVPDFVNIHSFDPQKTGILMGELMRGSINKVCGYNIIQEKFSHLFRVSDSGLISLKTAPKDYLKSGDASLSVKSSILGTFSITSGKLYIFAKVVSNADGKITKMTSKEVNLSCD